MKGDLPDRVKQAIPVAVVVHALRLLAPFDREALRAFSRALYYADARNPVGTGGRRPSPREEPATALLPAELTESKDRFWLEPGPVVATHALPNDLILAAICMAWMEADQVHGGLRWPSQAALTHLCTAVAVHHHGAALRKHHRKWTSALRDHDLEVIDTPEWTGQKGKWWYWCQQAAAALGLRTLTGTAGYESAVRPYVRVDAK